MKFNLNERKTKETTNREGGQSLNDPLYEKKAEWFKRLRELLVVTAR